MPSTIPNSKPPSRSSTRSPRGGDGSGSSEPPEVAPADAPTPPGELTALAARLTAVQAGKAARAIRADLAERTRTNRLAAYRPYPKQAAFHAAGAEHRERLLMAGNQLGKTLAGAAEMAMHLTGRYPDWWQGRRFDRPVTAMAGSETAELTRDALQRLLIGPPADPGEWGTGAIPKRDLIDTARRQGVADALDTAVVRHRSGGRSLLLFKSYDQGRRKWQANTVDVVWFDEEPPLEVYLEGLTRTNATGGLVYLTFTPLLGMSDVVRLFLGEGDG